MNSFLVLLLPALLFPAHIFSQTPLSPNEKEWYKDAVIYSIDVKTFKDGDGDGNGDFQGLTGKLGYIDSLGVNTIWLQPFQPSPLEDDGYDITDYLGIDPRVGTKQDFVRFLDSCHRRQIRVIMDLVLDHTSDKHPWFAQAARSENGRRDWFFWQQHRPAFADSGVAFPGVQKETWTYNAPAKAWYYHRFYDFQPHLNFYLPVVQKTAAEITGYWLATGIDGFRVDAVPFMIEKPDPDKDTAYQLFSYIPVLHKTVGDEKRNAMLLGEANVLPGQLPEYTGRRGEGLQMMFNFYVNQFLFYGLASGDVSLLRKSLRETKVPVPSFQWVNFLRNHDEIDLGRLAPEDRGLAFRRFGPDKTMQLYDRGVRRRLAPMLGDDRKKIELAYSLAAGLPGAFMIRYGEELGMGDDLSLKERLSVRTPMQWTSADAGGFTTGGHPIRPLISDDTYGYQKINVDTENADSSSLLQWMKRLIRVRKDHPEIAHGAWEIADSSAPGVLAIRYQFQGKQLLVVENCSDKNVRIAIPDGGAGHRLVPLFHQTPGILSARGQFAIAAPALSYEWYSVNPK